MNSKIFINKPYCTQKQYGLFYCLKKVCHEFHKFSLIFTWKPFKKFATDCTDLNGFFFSCAINIKIRKIRELLRLFAVARVVAKKNIPPTLSKLLYKIIIFAKLKSTALIYVKNNFFQAI